MGLLGNSKTLEQVAKVARNRCIKCALAERKRARRESTIQLLLHLANRV